MAISNEKQYFTYEEKNSKGQYEMIRTSEGKIVAFTDKKSLLVFAENQKTNGLLRILDLTEDIRLGNILMNRLEILN